MGTQNPTIASTLTQKRDANTSQVKESQRPSKKQPGTMMTKTKSMALCACLAAMLLASPALANRNLLGEMDDAMDAMNATMDMNMTANATEMANDNIADAAEEIPASDDGRRKLLQLEGLQDSVTGVVDKAKDAASDAKDKVTDVANKAVDKATAPLQVGVDKVNDFIGSAAGNVSALANETEGNMTMNGTEMADDEIEGEDAEEMPASDDGRRKLLGDDTMDMMNDTMMNMTANATEMANDTITDAAEEMPASDDGRRKLLAGHEGHSDDDTMDMMNDTMMNMTANATEMANDTITDAAEEMP